MKNWEVPAVEELDVKLTANGFWNSKIEFFGESNNSKAEKNPNPTPDPTPNDKEQIS